MNTITPSTDVHHTGPLGGVGPVDGERSYRYPGSPPFRDVEIDRRLFKGRDEEAKQVFHSILSSGVFLLYAVSGMGKSSLLNAGVMHRLHARGYWPVSVRLNETTLTPVQSIDRQIAEADLRDTEVEVLRTPGLDFPITADTTLWDLLGSLEVWRDDRLQQLVVVLDQFEELFTLDWKDDVRLGFISQFGEVVRGHRSVGGDDVADTSAVPVPNVKFCIVIREDTLGELEALADDVPQILQNRFRLSALDATQAESAIREPAMVADGALDTPPFRYSELAAQQILQFLQDTERATTGAVTETNVAGSVDPSQLQIICQYVERRVLPGKGTPPGGEVVTIEAADLGGDDGLRGVLGDFYRRTIATFPPAIQRSVQHLCEDGLISKSGRRLSLEREEISVTYGVPPGVLHELVDQRLLRVEPRVGSEYYELSHDTLVKPILDDRSERRKAKTRHRRRFAIIAGGALALVVLGFLAYRIGFDDGSESVASLELDTPLAGNVEQPGSVESFKVVGREEPTLIVVEPSEQGGFDASVELTNASKARRQSDHLGRGQAERIVVPAGTADVSDVMVGSSDGSTGPFDVTLTALAVTSLSTTEATDETIRGAIDEPGAMAVYSVEITDDPSGAAQSAIAIDVTSPQSESPPPESTPQETSNNAEGGRSRKAELGLDVEIEVIDPAGVGTIFDLESAGGGERAAVGGVPGEYLIVVRDHGTGTGEFDIRATKVVAMAANDDAGGDVPLSDSVVFAIDVPAGDMVGVTVTPTGELDPVLEIVHPRAGHSTVDSTFGGDAEEALLTTEGLYLLSVSGYTDSVGAFEIVTTPVDAQPLGEGEPTTAMAPAAFDVDVSGDHLVVVRTEGDLDPVIEVFDPQGGRTSVDSAGPGAAEVALLRGNGRYVVRVSGFEQSTGSFEIVSTQADSVVLAEGDEVTTASPAMFEVDVVTDQLLSFTAESATDSLLSIQVTGPDGLASGIPFGSAAPGDPATAVIDGAIPGRYQIMVAASDAQSDIAASLESVETQPLVVNDPVTALAPVVFSVEVVGEEFYSVTAQPESVDGQVSLEVQDADGVATAYGGSASPGEPATVTLGGTPGTFVVRARSIGSRPDITAVLESVAGQQLNVGDPPATVSAPAIFDVDVVEGERRLIIATPQDDDQFFMEIFSPGRDEPWYVYAADSGEPVVALLAGEGAHQVRVTGSGVGGEFFVVETEQVGGVP